MAISAPLGNSGWPAADFELPYTFDKHQAQKTLRGSMGSALIFICTHCPYVKTIIDRIFCQAKIQAMGFGIAAIIGNNTHAYSCTKTTS